VTDAVADAKSKVESARQEVEIKLNGSTFSVRPTFEIIANIEAATDQPARMLGMRALLAGVKVAERPPNASEIKMSELATAIFWMLRGKKGAPESPQAVGDILMEDGYLQLLDPVGMFLVRAQRGNKEHEKEATQATASTDP